jgi:hypothetical protein
MARAVALGVFLVGFAFASVGGAQIPGVDAVARPGVAPGETALDEVVASLELEGDAQPRFVLRSEFVLLVRLELYTRGAPGALDGPVDATWVGWPTFEELMGLLQVAREAERSGMGNPDPEALAAMRRRLLRLMRDEQGIERLLEATHASPAEFDTLLRRLVVAREFLSARRARLVEPTDTELRQAYEGDDPRYRMFHANGEGFAAARRAMRDEWVNRALPSALRQYLRALGSRVRVRVFTPSAVTP